MRYVMFALPALALAACGDSAAPEEKAAAAAALTPGLYQVTSEVTRFESTDEGTPAIDTPVGTRTEASICLDEENAARPDPALFVGEEESCGWERFYMRNGRINSGLTCELEGHGQVMRNVTGTFQAESFEATIDTNTYFPGDGDVRIGSTISGQRTGDCPAGTAEG